MRSTDLISPAVEPGSAAAVEAACKSPRAANSYPSPIQRLLLAIAYFLDGCIASQPHMTRSGYANMCPAAQTDKIETTQQ